MYSGSQTSSKDMNLLFPSSTFKNSEGDLQRNNREVSMDVNLFQRRHHQNQQQQQQQQQQQNQQQLNSGLMRYRSAPSSLLANFINGDDEGEGCDNFIPPHSSPEAETIFARFMSCAANDSDLREIGEKPTVAASVVNNRNPQFMAAMDQETEENGFPPASQMMFQTPPPPPPPPQNTLQNQSSNPTENSYRVVNSMAMDQHPSQLKMGSTTNSSNLIRHSSSPAGLFSRLNVENGYAVMRGVGNFSAGNGTNGDATASNSRLKSQMSFPSRPPSSSGLMSQISEIESESIGGGNSGEEGSLSNGNGNGNNRFIPGYPIASWDDSGLENFTGIKRNRDINNKMLSGLNPSETQNGDAGNHTTPGLTHHFSLPKTSAEMAAIMQFQDSVPCKIRAKRGCATHPRSIAERVRRTRISERMRKLQELVPNMDKQTNTADMLDLAVEYIKDLQKQVKTLNDNRANCTCSSKQKL